MDEACAGALASSKNEPPGRLLSSTSKRRRPPRSREVRGDTGGTGGGRRTSLKLGGGAVDAGRRTAGLLDGGAAAEVPVPVTAAMYLDGAQGDQGAVLGARRSQLVLIRHARGETPAPPCNERPSAGCWHGPVRARWRLAASRTFPLPAHGAGRALGARGHDPPCRSTMGCGRLGRCGQPHARSGPAGEQNGPGGGAGSLWVAACGTVPSIPADDRTCQVPAAVRTQAGCSGARGSGPALCSARRRA